MMTVMLLFLLAALSFTVDATSSPAPPTWPKSFETTYTLELPYVSVVQSVGLKVNAKT